MGNAAACRFPGARGGAPTLERLRRCLNAKLRATGMKPLAVVAPKAAQRSETDPD